MSDWRFNTALRQQLQQHIAVFENKQYADSDSRSAAVAVVVVADAQDNACVLLTLRSHQLGRHAGQFALPGGRVDDGESTEQAARRELHEELGLELGSDALLGRLDDYCTRSGFCISPFVYWGGRQPLLRPSADEVAEVYWIPLSELDSVAIPLFDKGVEEGRPVLYSCLPSLGDNMYSPTAALLYQFREVALRGLDTRVAHYDQPAFAWR